ncbi:MAG: hypothetical protein ACK5P7_11210 [Bdellovibrio sp.]|jgi:hypothetical protein
MKTILLLAWALLMFHAANAASGSSNSKTKAHASPSRDRAKLGTSFRFDGSSLHGKFQNSPSTTATVENDKFLEDLLGARKHFDDRLKEDQERQTF